MPKAKTKLKENQEKVLAFFLKRGVGRIVEKDELVGHAGTAVVRHIHDLTRLEGWRISSRVDRPELQLGQYVLEADRPLRMCAVCRQAEGRTHGLSQKPVRFSSASYRQKEEHPASVCLDCNWVLRRAAKSRPSESD